MKILIAADMEGISGVVNWDQVSPAHAEYARFRRLMTGDVNAAIAGAFAGGASEVIVADGHAGGCNLLLEELDGRARLNSGNDAPFAMVQGIGSDIDGVLFVGYHARAGSPQAILDHTWSSSRVANLWLNEQLVGETGLNAALCGHYGAPVLMLSGDQTACAQAVELLGALETVQVKTATSRYSAECLPLQSSQAAIAAAAETALRCLRAGQAPSPFRLAEPIHLTVEFFSSQMADGASHLPGATRQGCRISLTLPDMPAAYLAFQAVVDLAPSG
jgi:D-amino peptidase